MRDQPVVEAVSGIFNPTFPAAACRAVVLRLVGLCVLLFTLWSQVTCSGNLDEDDCRLCQYNHKLYQVNHTWRTWYF